MDVLGNEIPNGSPPKFFIKQEAEDKPDQQEENFVQKRRSENIAIKESKKAKLNIRSAEEVTFDAYLKKKFVKIFQNEGCSPLIVARYANLNNVKIKDVNDYFDEVAKQSQSFVYQECDSFSFSNITEWLEYMQATGFERQCDYEAAVVMRAVANNEYHCDPNEIEGINLKDIYQFLSNALMGMPQKPLDEASSKFLCNEFMNLISEANTDEADNNVRDMKRQIEYSIHNQLKSKFPELDPLNTDNDHLEVYLKSIKVEHESKM